MHSNCRDSRFALVTLMSMACLGAASMRPVSADVIFVDETRVGGADDGSSWQDAFRGAGGVEAALSAAVGSDEIWVAAGRYVPTASGNRFVSFRLKTGVEVYGGFAGTEVSLSQRDYTANETILSGDLAGNDPSISENSYNVVDGNFTNVTAVLDGFTITGGNANHSSSQNSQTGGGLIVREGSHPTIRNCWFVNNRVVFGGGAIYFRSSSPTIINCVFENNNGGAFGGAFDMFNNSSPTITDCRFIGNIARRAGGVEVFGNCSPVLTNCSFENNTATSGSGFGGGMFMANGGLPRLNNCRFIGNTARSGGGVYNQSTSPRFNNCVFLDNSLSISSGQGGAMYNTAASPRLTNCLIADNQAGTGAGIRNLTSSNAVLINCTIARNTATSVGGGVANLNNAASLTSCIVWGNTDTNGGGSASQINDLGSASTTVRFSDVAGGWTGNGNDNIAVDPAFLGAGIGNYRIASSSPCVDTGDPSLFPIAGAEADLDRHDRILCDRVDMGAYESGFADADCDRDVDLLDFAALLDCVAGPGVAVADACIPFDTESDGDVDWADVADFQTAFTAP